VRLMLLFAFVGKGLGRRVTVNNQAQWDFFLMLLVLNPEPAVLRGERSQKEVLTRRVGNKAQLGNDSMVTVSDGAHRVKLGWTGRSCNGASWGWEERVVWVGGGKLTEKV